MRRLEQLTRSDAATAGFAAGIGWLIGAVSWCGVGAALVLAPAIVPLWACQPNRARAWVVVLGYYMAAGKGLPVGAAQFYGMHTSIIAPIAMWVVASGLLAGAWALLWGRSGFVWRVPAALVVTIVPPLGIIGWTNPITAAGVYFPGLAWLGLGAMVLFMAALCYPSLRVLAYLLVILANSPVDPPTAPNWIAAHQTLFGGAGASRRDFMRDYEANMFMIDQVRDSPAIYQLYPESVAGLWSDATQELWAPVLEDLAQQGRSVLLGAEVPVEGSAQYRNALVMAGSETGLFVQRVPVPISMWRPWADDGAIADLWGDGIGEINGTRVAVFICHEQGIVWPMLLSQVARPALLIGAANTYWANGTSIQAIQAASMTSWSALFGTPLVMAFNH